MRKFKWNVHEGQYCIYDVPVFRETTVVKNGKPFEFDGNGLRLIISEFLDKKKTGFLPTIHRGHNNTIEDDKPVMGFLDNLRLFGRFLIADLVGINHEAFMEIKNRLYPYRSVEIYGKSYFLKSCALLASKTPQFLDLGALLLEEKPSPEKKLELYQMENLEETDLESQKPSEEPINMSCEQKILKMLETMQPALNQILELMKGGKENYGLNNTSSMNQEVANQTGKEKGVMPRTLNYSDEGEKKELLRKITLLEEERDGHLVVSELQQLCEKYHLNFSENLKKMEVFTSVGAKREFLKILPCDMPDIPHVTEKALNFSSVSQPEEKMVRELRVRYQQELKDPASARRTKTFYKDEDDYVNYFVSLEKKA